MASHDTVVIGDSLYLWGGLEPGLFINENQSKLNIFDLASGLWSIKTTIGNPPQGVVGYSCSTLKDRIYYFGGYDISNSHHNSINELDTSNLTWKELQPTNNAIPVMKRAYGGMLTVEADETHLMVIGGEGRSLPIVKDAKFIRTPTGRVITNECNMYNIFTGKFIKNMFVNKEFFTHTVK